MKCTARFCDVCLMDSIKRYQWIATTKANVQCALEIVAAVAIIGYFMSLFV